MHDVHDERESANPEATMTKRKEPKLKPSKALLAHGRELSESIRLLYRCSMITPAECDAIVKRFRKWAEQFGLTVDEHGR